jgi:hypothetical protein
MWLAGWNIFSIGTLSFVAAIQNKKLSQAY